MADPVSNQKNHTIKRMAVGVGTFLILSAVTVAALLLIKTYLTIIAVVLFLWILLTSIRKGMQVGKTS